MKRILPLLLCFAMIMPVFAFSKITAKAYTYDNTKEVQIVSPSTNGIYPQSDVKALFHLRNRTNWLRATVYFDGMEIQTIEAGAVEKISNSDFTNQDRHSNFETYRAAAKEVYNISSENVYRYYFYLDLPQEKLTVGKHTFEVNAQYYDSGVRHDNVEAVNFEIFDLPVKSEKINTDFSNFEGTLQSTQNNAAHQVPMRATNATVSKETQDGNVYVKMVPTSTSLTFDAALPNQSTNYSDELKNERIIAEMDLWINDKVKKLNLEYLCISDAIELFKNTGLICDTKYRYRQNQWAHLTLDLDGYSKKVRLYYNNLLVYDGVVPEARLSRGVPRIELVFGDTSSDCTIGIDNFKLYTVAPLAHNLTYDGKAELLDTLTIPSDTKVIAFDVTGKFNDEEADKKIVLKKDGIKVENAVTTYDSEADKLSIDVTNASLTDGKYQIEFPAGLKMNETLKDTTAQIQLSEEYYNEFQVATTDKIYLEKIGNKYLATAYHNSSSANSVKAIIATYDNNELSDIAISDISLTNGINKIEFSYTPVSGTDAKAMIFTDMTTLVPLAISAIKQQ